MKKILYSSLVLGALVLTSCSKDFTENDQGSSFSNDKIESLVKFPEAALLFNESVEAGGVNAMRKGGIAQVGQHEDFGQKAVEIIMDAMSNDVSYGNMNWFTYWYVFEDRLADYGTGVIFNYYSRLANAANLTIQSVMKTDVKYQESAIYGRALALRSFANLYLIQLYEYDGQGIPYQYVDEKGNLVEHLARSTSQDMQKMIETDLLKAYDVLKGKGRPTKEYIGEEVVAGMLSRFYLYTKNFEQAKVFALNALQGDLKANNFTVVNEGNFANANNVDWMWGAVIDGSRTTTYASYFSHMDSFNKGYGGYNKTSKSIDKRLYDHMSSTDVRKDAWFADGKKEYTSKHWDLDKEGKPVYVVIPQYVNKKFQDPTTFLGHYSYMRKSEMLFNYMEAAYQLGAEGDAKAVLADYMASRDAKYDVNKFSGEALFKEIQAQKRIELWGEGFGLLDMKRWGVALERNYEGSNHTLTRGKINIPANSAEFTMQFPQVEINANDELKGHQNPVN